MKSSTEIPPWAGNACLKAVEGRPAPRSLGLRINRGRDGMSYSNMHTLRMHVSLCVSHNISGHGLGSRVRVAVRPGPAPGSGSTEDRLTTNRVWVPQGSGTVAVRLGIETGFTSGRGWGFRVRPVSIAASLEKMS